MTLRELQTQLMEYYGITAKWVETGGGQLALEIHVSDVGDYGAYLYIGSEEFEFINELDTPVSTVSGTMDDNGFTDSFADNVPIGDMARLVAGEMLARTGMLNP